MLEAISQQMSLLFAERRSDCSCNRSLTGRSEQYEVNLRRDRPSPKRQGGDRRLARSKGGKCTPKYQWGDNRMPKRLEVGWQLELLVFSGDDAYGWLARFKRFFRVNGVEDYAKMS